MSPTVFHENGRRYFFFSREEPRMHVHVVSAEGKAKFWLEPAVELASSAGFSQRRLKQIRVVIEKRHDELVAAWKRHFGTG